MIEMLSSQVDLVLIQKIQAETEWEHGLTVADYGKIDDKCHTSR